VRSVVKEGLVAESSVQEVSVDAESTRYGSLPKWAQIAFVTLTVLGIILAVLYINNVPFGGEVIISQMYYYLLFGIFEACAFLILPARKSHKNRIPWYDVVLAAIALGLPVYFAMHVFEITHVGWVPAPDTMTFIMALLASLIFLEGGRRMAGWFFFGLCIFMWIYPLFAEHMPGFFFGISYPFDHITAFITFGGSGIIGLPGRIMGEILIGFLIFAGMLIASGAGEFFIKLSMALMGRFRGGPAKVAVVSSGFFGSMSGSVISNIVATGSFTIPAMKRMGYPPRYAGAIEACASTGGGLMPPVMGLTAFVMAIIVGVDYAEIIVAAALPAILYYFGLLMQVDAFAARTGLVGLPKEELPSFWKTLREGWQFIAVLFFLIWGFLYMRWSWITPYYAAGLMLLLSYLNRKTMITPKKLVKAFVTIGRMISQTMSLVLPFAFLLAGMSLTGVDGAFTTGLVRMGGGNVFFILGIGVVACYLMGMLGMGIIAYILLAVSMAPAVLQLDPSLNILAVHLFILYYGMLSAISPPVAIGAYVGAALAGASPLKTAITATRLGVVLLFIPFYFVYNPALILQGEWWQTLIYFPLALLGILFITAGLEGYLLKVGRIISWARPIMVVAGLAVALPAQDWPLVLVPIVGAAIAAAIILLTLTRRRELQAGSGVSS